MNFETYAIQLGSSTIDLIKFVWIVQHGNDSVQMALKEAIQLVAQENPKMTLLSGSSEAKSQALDSSKDEDHLLDRLAKSRVYELGELVRIELAILSRYYLDRMQWSKVIQYCAEEETLSMSGIHRLESLGKLLIAHMAMQDYVRAALVADKIESTFHCDQEGGDHLTFLLSDDYPAILRGQIIVLLGLLSLVRDKQSQLVGAFLQRPKDDDGLLSNSINSIDLRAYKFILSVFYHIIPTDSCVFGDILSLLSSSSPSLLDQYIAHDPWLSSVKDLQGRLLIHLKDLLRDRIIGASQCVDSELQDPLLSLQATDQQ